MLNPKLTTITEKNKLVSDVPWHTLLEIHPSASSYTTDVLYVCDNIDGITYKGNYYQPLAFQLDAVEMKSSGELPQVQLRVSNVNGLLQNEIEQYNGGVDATVVIKFLPNSDLNGDPDLTATFTIINTNSNAEWVTFTLGAENPMRQLFPKFLYFAGICVHQYNTPAMQTSLDIRGVKCNYQGNLTSCSKRLNGDNGCRVHNNVSNFGGYPTVDVTGFRRASVS